MHRLDCPHLNQARKGIYSTTDQLGAAAGSYPNTPVSMPSLTTGVSATVNRVPLCIEELSVPSWVQCSQG
eukprot:4081352-Prorocentrum_lima.AAC.1